MSNTVETVEVGVVQAKSWLLLHERLIVTVLVLAVGVFFLNMILTRQAERDKLAANAAQQALSEQHEENKTLAAEVIQSQQQTSALVAQLTSQNAQLAQGIQSRTVVLQTQQRAIQTLPIPDVVSRWTQLTGSQPNALTTTSDGVSVTPEAARTTVSQLEEVPVLRANLADTQAQNANLTSEITSVTDLNGKLTTQVTGLQTELVDQTVACKKEVASVKADARKGKLHWFAAGFGLGWLSGIATGHYLHL